MARVRFSPQGAWDPARGEPARNAELVFFAIDDTSNITPLRSFNRVGNEAPVISTEDGWLREFELDGLPEGATQARWVATGSTGEWSGVVESPDALRTLVLNLTGAMQELQQQNAQLVESAAAAARAAQDAADRAGDGQIPRTGTPNTLLGYDATTGELGEVPRESNDGSPDLDVEAVKRIIGENPPSVEALSLRDGPIASYPETVSLVELLTEMGQDASRQVSGAYDGFFKVSWSVADGRYHRDPLQVPQGTVERWLMGGPEDQVRLPEITGVITRYWQEVP